MDPTTTELLSRYLDGDLDDAEAELFELRVAAEPELAGELEALRRLQRQVRAVAERMEPPAELDATLLPLQRGTAPPPRRIHPAVRWIGMAAGLALAVTVVIEVARRPAAPLPGARPAATPQSSEPFQLSPLPTTATPEEEQPLGAADRLLASPPAEVPLPEPAPLDVRGPLSEQEAIGAADAVPHGGKGSLDAARPSSTGEADSAGEARQRAAPGNEAKASPESAAASVAAPSAARLQDETRSSEAAGRVDAKKELAAPARLVVLGADGSRVAELEVDGVPEPRAELVVTVHGEVIVALDGPLRDATRRSALGRKVPGLADGRYRATIEPSQP